jgi:hypothetical protein
MQKTELLSATILSFLLNLATASPDAANDSLFCDAQEEKRFRQTKHKRNLLAKFITEPKA